MSALEQGKTILVMAETVSVAGSISRSFSLDCDTVQTSLFVSSISGTLSVVISTVTGEGHEKEVITYSNITAVTPELVLRRAATAMGTIKAVATYTGACSFQIRAKGLSSGITSASMGKATQVTVTGTPSILIPAAIAGRRGVILKNWSTSYTMFIGFSAAQATSVSGYPIGSKEALGIDIGAGAVIWAVSGTENPIDVRIIEAGD